MSAFDYWASGSGLDNITPHGKMWPEGEDFGSFLADIIAGSSVCEFGCGIGRLAWLFPADRYIGVDICREAINLAKAALPTHRFELIGPSGSLPAADVTLAHTVMLHVPDEHLFATVRRFRSERVIISEILGRHWRRPGNPPVFNRELDDYCTALRPLWSLQSVIRRPYTHYAETDLTIAEFGLGPLRDASRPVGDGGPGS